MKLVLRIRKYTECNKRNVFTIEIRGNRGKIETRGNRGIVNNNRIEQIIEFLNIFTIFTIVF